jgi:Histone-like transcription factor (CBF/NF-Y) and archaeal histone
MAGVEEETEHVIEDVIETVENSAEVEQDNEGSPEKQERILRFPLTRIKTIIKTDTDVTIASHDAVVLIAKATV